jgi:hypothetical protein
MLEAGTTGFPSIPVQIPLGSKKYLLTDIILDDMFKETFSLTLIQLIYQRDFKNG